MAYFFGQGTGGIDLNSLGFGLKQPDGEAGGASTGGTSKGTVTPGKLRRPIEKKCRGDAECAGGEYCFNGTCVPKTITMTKCVSDADCAKLGAGFVCYDGECMKGPATKCNSDAGCPAGQRCIAGKCQEDPIITKKCVSDAGCPAGQKCLDGKCQEGTTPGGCPDGVGAAYNGCPCGKDYMLKSGACVEGYVPVPKPNGTQCECRKMCVETGWGEDCQTSSASKLPKLGEFDWPADMKNFWSMLSGRGTDLLKRPLGFTPEETAGYFGRDFENIRGQEAGAKQAMTSALSRQGMLGTGTALKALGDLAWGTEKNVGDVQRDVFLADEAQKRKDLTDYTTLSNTLFGSGMNFSQIREAINAARRGETQNALSMLLAMMNLFKK